MNGVRKLFGAATGAGSGSLPSEDEIPPPVPPLGPSPVIVNGKNSTTNWPPQSPTGPGSRSTTVTMQGPASTAALFLRKDKDKNKQHARSSTVSSSSSSPRPNHKPSLSVSSSVSATGSLKATPRTTRKPVNGTLDLPPVLTKEANLNTRDELLISLLASEAVVDCRNFDILSSEEVDDLKKEQEVLSSRVQAAQKKLNLETKIRDAAVSLSKVNASTNKKIAKQTDEQLDAAHKRVEAAQKEYWRLSERSNEVSKKLLEHRAGVLSLSVRSMEKKAAPSTPTSGYSTPSRSQLNGSRTPLSPTVSVSSGSTKVSSRFDGAHFFAGHADALFPRSSNASIADLETKLKSTADALAEATKRQANTARELSMLKLEKEQVETSLGMELQSAQDMIEGLEREIPRLEEVENEVEKLRKEKRDWQQEREDYETRLGGGEVLEEKNSQLRQLREQLEAERQQWDEERVEMEDSKMEDLSRLQEEMEKVRDQETDSLKFIQEDVEEVTMALKSIVRTHNISLYSSSSRTRPSPLKGLAESIGVHLDTVGQSRGASNEEKQEWETMKKRMEDDIRVAWDKREALSKDLEEARREREEARKELRSLEGRMKDLPYSDQLLRSPPSPRGGQLSPLFDNPTSPGGGELTASKIIFQLQPLWSILPSPEARAAKFGKNFRAGSPQPSPTTPNSPSSVKSLSELDVRALKSLYDSQGGRSYPGSPVNASSAFTIDAFIAKVQALLNDDRALIERLVRFAQAHDLLKKNAERAQKLAQEGSIALETYQKQVKTLEERNMTLGERQADLQDEVAQMQETIGKISNEKRDIEAQAGEQAETMRQLTETNNTLSAKTLALAEEAAGAGNMQRVKQQLEAQLAETKKTLDNAQKEVEEMKMNDQMQRMQLLEEMNTLQEDNGKLREQMRALQK